MYPSPELELTIATATQRERIARGWRPRSARTAWTALFPASRRS